MRRKGRSTRIADRAIQDLFTNGNCLIRDHWHSYEADRILLNRVLDRLKLEHYIDESHMSVSFDNRKISITLNTKGVEEWMNY